MILRQPSQAEESRLTLNRPGLIRGPASFLFPAPQRESKENVVSWKCHSPAAMSACLPETVIVFSISSSSLSSFDHFEPRRSAYDLSRLSGEEQNMLGTILIVIVVLALIGALPRWSHSREWGYAPTGGLGIVLFVVVILLVLGRI
jgi:Protein of unknown function (DUF3309)